MSFYESVFIVRPDVATNQVDAIAEKMSEVVTKNQGKVVKTENWGLRTLAYRIKKYKKGYYVMLGLEMPGAAVIELERNMKLAEDIIRFHTIKMDKLEDGPSIILRNKNKFEDMEAPAAFDAKL
ncbi:MAG: 30S ribosomal protein S6 [Alphaproteobacteria bacterium]